MGSMVVLVSVLWWQYNDFLYQTQQLVSIQEDYQSYVDLMRKVLREKKNESVEDDSDDSLEEDDIEVDSFMVINRQPQYLKESTLTYLKEQRLESLAPRMNMHELQNYTDQLTISKAKPKEKKKSKRSKVPIRQKVQSWNMRPTRRTGVVNARFIWPIEKPHFWLSSFFGPRRKPNGSWGFHYGLDMAAQRGTPVYAGDDGVVVQAQYVSGYGNTVVIQHDARYKTRYAHLDRIHVKKDQTVSKHQKIGLVGDTGFTITSGKDASHLHFEVYDHGKQVNPLNYLPA